MNDSDLLHGIRQRDPAAIQHLTRCYLSSIWRFVYHQVHKDHHLAEDIVSECVLALVREVSQGGEVRSVEAWLRTVAGRRVRDHFRAAARVRHLLQQVQQTSESTSRHDDTVQAARNEERQAIRRIMEQLPAQQRLALEWKYLDRLSVRELASRLGTTEKAVESILFRARQEFRRRYQAYQRSGKSTDDWDRVEECGASESASDEVQLPAAVEFENDLSEKSR